VTAKSATTLSVALIHCPVVNKNKEIISSAFTNLDIHDIARAAKTYGVDKYYIVSPHQDQLALLTELLDHWLNGYGARYNPARKQALSLIQLEKTLEDVIAGITKDHGEQPIRVATSAIQRENNLSYKELRTKLRARQPVLLLLGTAHGLAPEVVEKSDYTLQPIDGGTGYNHLSVRSAAAIMLDRLLAD